MWFLHIQLLTFLTGSAGHLLFFFFCFPCYPSLPFPVDPLGPMIFFLSAPPPGFLSERKHALFVSVELLSLIAFVYLLRVVSKV